VIFNKNQRRIKKQKIAKNKQNTKMTDIFDNQILCNGCKKVMKPALVNKNGFNLRAIKCEKCGEIVYHPADKKEYEEFIRLKQKDFNVKMRMVGNSYAVSIPREIVDFMHDQENMMNHMVKLCFEEAGRISLMFNNESESENTNTNSQVIKAREVKVIKNNRPVLHVKQVSDSAHPERNQTKIFKSNRLNEEESEEDGE
jgi:hypothetical protein